MRRTVAGSSCGSQTRGALSACKCGSKGKPHPPTKGERVDVYAFHPVDGPTVVSLVRRIAPQVFPRKLPMIEFVHISIGGRRPPIGCRRHRVVSAKLL